MTKFTAAGFPYVELRQRAPRKKTFATEIERLQKEGITSGTITIDGVSLTFGEHHNAPDTTPHPDSDEWK